VYGEDLKAWEPKEVLNACSIRESHRSKEKDFTIKVRLFPRVMIMPTLGALSRGGPVQDPVLTPGLGRLPERMSATG